MPPYLLHDDQSRRQHVHSNSFSRNHQPCCLVLLPHFISLSLVASAWFLSISEPASERCSLSRLISILLYHIRMDPLSICASITALIQLTSTTVQYLKGVKGAPEDRQRILSELTSVIGILLILQDQADQAKQGDQWSSTLQSLNVPEGPLNQLPRALERLSSKLASPATGLKKLGKAIVWPFQKEEVKEILGSIERQKALLNLARQNDHM